MSSATAKPMTSGQCDTASLVAAGRQRSTCDPVRWHGMCRLDLCACDCHTAAEITRAQVERANPAIGATVDPAAIMDELSSIGALPAAIVQTAVTVTPERQAVIDDIVGSLF